MGQFVALLLLPEQPMHMLLTETQQQHLLLATEHLPLATELLNPLTRSLLRSTLLLLHTEQQKLLCRTSPQLSLESSSSPDWPCYSPPMSPSPPYAESEVPKVPKMRAQCPTWPRGSKTCTWLFFRARSVWRGLPVKLEVSPRMPESASLLPRLQHLSFPRSTAR